jgi:acyl phosphate:glycerol-3-phosphate acyltransferase
MELNYIIIMFVSYLIGTIPFAFIMIKILHGKDIRNEGTGNVGAMNSYDITGKKWIGISVMLLDLLKGVAAVWIARLMTNNDMLATGIAAFFVVMGHNYNVFLGMKGGRGLASAAGAALMINPILIFLWGIMYLTGFYAVKRDVHVGSSIATVALPIFLFSTPDRLVEMTSMIPIPSMLGFKLMMIPFAFLILTRHVKPLMDLIRKKESPTKK